MLKARTPSWEVRKERVCVPLSVSRGVVVSTSAKAPKDVVDALMLHDVVRLHAVVTQQHDRNSVNQHHAT